MLLVVKECEIYSSNVSRFRIHTLFDIQNFKWAIAMCPIIYIYISIILITTNLQISHATQS